MNTYILEEPPTIKHYALWGGGRIRGDTPESLVCALRQSSYHPCDSEPAFMEEISERCRFYNGAIISTYDPENFVEDLIHHGFLKEIGLDSPPEIIPFEPEEPKP